MEKSNYYDAYINHMAEIRSLSTLSLDGIHNAEDYSIRLRENFTRIGLLASDNRRFLDTTLFPLLHSAVHLSDAETDSMDGFCEKLLDAEELDNLDPIITVMVAERLLNDAVEKGEFLSQIRKSDLCLSALYTLMNITGRITEYPEIAMEFRKKGFELGAFFLSLRQRDRLAAIPYEEIRELILTNSRFISAFFENLCGDPEENSNDLVILEESLAIGRDPSYRKLVPELDWDCYEFRVLSYFAIAPDYHNARGFTPEQLSLICDRTEEVWNLWHEKPEKYVALESETYLSILLLRNRYLAGKLSDEDYLREMLSLYEKRVSTDYEMSGIAENILIPTEILCVLENRRLTEAHKILLSDFYTNIVNYAFLMPNSGIFSYMLEYISNFLQHFIEIPEGIQFEEIMLDLLAAMHPPTYVHSRMVAQLTSCICGHLIDLHPDLFTGIFDLATEEEVKQSRSQLIHFACHAALCHDAGKLFIIDTVFVYGRKLEDMEFNLIKTHPKMGAEFLRRYPSTASYAEIALGHHKWFDNSRGYPEEFDTSKSKLKTIIDIVCCADCLDAATDTIGRSYSRGKTLDDFIEELKTGSGTRYAPWLVDLFSRKEVRDDIVFLLEISRERNYRNTYHLLKNVHDESRTAGGKETES